MIVEGLIVIWMLGGLIGISFLLISVLDKDCLVNKKLCGILLLMSLICFLWLKFSCSIPKQYEIKTYPIYTINENTQVANVDGTLFNINKYFGKIAKSNQMLEVKTITNHFRGGVYFTSDEPEYNLIEEK